NCHPVLYKRPSTCSAIFLQTSAPQQSKSGSAAHRSAVPRLPSGSQSSEPQTVSQEPAGCKTAEADNARNTFPAVPLPRQPSAPPQKSLSVPCRTPRGAAACHKSFLSVFSSHLRWSQRTHVPPPCHSQIESAPQRQTQPL